MEERNLLGEMVFVNNKRGLYEVIYDEGEEMLRVKLVGTVSAKMHRSGCPIHAHRSTVVPAEQAIVNLKERLRGESERETRRAQRRANVSI